MVTLYVPAVMVAGIVMVPIPTRAPSLGSTPPVSVAVPEIPDGELLTVTVPVGVATGTG